MSEKPKLTDTEVYDLIHAAIGALGQKEGATARGDTSIKAARKGLRLLQLGLLMAMEKDSDVNIAIKAPDETSAP
jgi:hypothetical protein